MLIYKEDVDFKEPRMAVPSSLNESTTLKKIDSSKVFSSIGQINNKKITVLIETELTMRDKFEVFN